MIEIEVAVETLVSAAAAEAGGATRLELCADLDHGGITPDDGLIRDTLAQARVPVFPMVRPRPGDFVYTTGEVAEMVRDIERLALLGAHGFVTGALTARSEVDLPTMRALLSAAAGLPVTFHRAFDRVTNQQAALDQLASVGVARILTSAGAPSALEGAMQLRDLIAHASGRLVILAGGGVREDNVAQLIRQTGVTEVHTKLKERADEEVSAQRMQQFVNETRRAEAGR